MLALRPAEDSKKTLTSIQPNVLPCKIHQDGPLEISSRHWSPTVDADNPELATAYFRGRRLRGRKVDLPEGYQGIIAAPTTKTLNAPEPNPLSQTNQPRNDHNDDDEGDEEKQPEEPPTILEAQNNFSSIMIWDHEKVPPAIDPLVKGINEWIQFAGSIHSDTKKTT